MTEDMAVDMTVNTTEDPQPYIEFDKLKVAQLRRVLIDEFDFSESEVKNIKGKANLLKEIRYQINPDVDESILDNLEVTEESTTENKTTTSISPPLPCDPEWTDYVLSALTDDEKIKDKNSSKEYPTTDGLRRLVEKFVGVIVNSHTQIHQVPTPENERRATVSVTIGVMSTRINENMSFCGAADVYIGNLTHPFCQHPVASAETKGEGRAYKKALKIKVSTYEEMVMGEAQSDLPEDFPADPQFIKNDQINFIDTICSRMDINVKKFIKGQLVDFDDELQKIPYDKAGSLLAVLQKYQGNEKDIEEGVKGYRGDWQVVWSVKPF